MDERRSLAMAQEVVQLIASQLPNDVRMMQGALNRIQATSDALGQPITVSLAHSALADLVVYQRQTFGLGDVERVVCGMFKLDRQMLRSKCRSRAVSHPACWQCGSLAVIPAPRCPKSATTSAGGATQRRVCSKDSRTLDQGRCRGTAADRDCHVRETIRQLEAQLRAG